MNEEKELTLYDVEQMKLKKLAETDDPDEVIKLTESVVNLHNAQVDESVKVGQVENDSQRVETDKERAETDKKRLKNDIITTIIGSLIGAFGVIGAGWIREETKGRWDDIFQDHGYGHEKTESVIYNYRKHRR